MKFCNEQSEKIRFSLKNEIGHGSTARVFKIDNNQISLKIYNYSAPDNFKLTRDIFEFLRSNPSSNFLNLLEMFFSAKRPTSNTNNQSIAAYTYNYIPNLFLELIMMDSDYLLENFANLEKYFEKLSKNRIIAADLKVGNTILTPNEIVLIDPDFFKKYSDLSFEYCQEINRHRLSFLMRALLYNEFRDNFDWKKIEELFPKDMDQTKEMSLELKRKLTKGKIIDNLR